MVPSHCSCLWAAFAPCSWPGHPDAVVRAQGNPASNGTLATSLFWPWTHSEALASAPLGSQPGNLFPPAGKWPIYHANPHESPRDPGHCTDPTPHPLRVPKMACPQSRPPPRAPMIICPSVVPYFFFPGRSRACNPEGPGHI